MPITTAIEHAAMAAKQRDRKDSGCSSSNRHDGDYRAMVMLKKLRLQSQSLPKFSHNCRMPWAVGTSARASPFRAPVAECGRRWEESAVLSKERMPSMVRCK